jgi:hypothetical protein
MSSYRRKLAIASLALVFAAGMRAEAGPDSGSEAGSLAAQMAKAMPEGPDSHTGHELQYQLEALEAVHTGIAIFGVEAGLLGLGLEVVGPLAAEAAVLLAIGNAHAEAINSVINDEIRRGFSYGVVLGADDRKPDYVKSNFVKWGPVPNVVYPEYGKKFQNAHNRALAAGYAQGKTLLAKKGQRAAFFEDLYAHMSTHPSIAYGEDQDAWSERSWRDYYIDCAATFRRHHLK